MMRKEEIIEGRYLRTLPDFFAVPAGTLAKVDSVGTTWQGEFVFTVRWLNIKAGTQQRPISDRSLNLWEPDLAHFEAVPEQDISGNGSCCSSIVPASTRASPWRFSPACEETSQPQSAQSVRTRRFVRGNAIRSSISAVSI